MTGLMAGRDRVILFDVNQTLLDLAPMAPVFAGALGSAESLREWFARLLHASLLANQFGNYRPFGELGVDVLAAMAIGRGLNLDRQQLSEVAGMMRRLPPHPEVAQSLAELSAGGYRLATLTNSSPPALAEQLEFAGIAKNFKNQISVEDVKRYKPAPEPYLHALEVMAVAPNQAVMVAAHDWDILGAQAVGITGVFVERPGAAWSHPDRPPDLRVPDLSALFSVLEG